MTEGERDWLHKNRELVPELVTQVFRSGRGRWICMSSRLHGVTVLATFLLL